jgi:hypothetical protein
MTTSNSTNVNALPLFSLYCPPPPILTLIFSGGVQVLAQIGVQIRVGVQIHVQVGVQIRVHSEFSLKFF